MAPAIPSTDETIQTTIYPSVLNSDISFTAGGDRIRLWQQNVCIVGSAIVVEAPHALYPYVGIHV